VSRRIGSNELTTIDVLLELVEAEHEYQAFDRDGGICFVCSTHRAPAHRAARKATVTLRAGWSAASRYWPTASSTECRAS